MPREYDLALCHELTIDRPANILLIVRGKIWYSSSMVQEKLCID